MSALLAVSVAFPGLQRLRLESIGIMTNDHFRNNHGWYEVAETIDRLYHGSCSLTFGDGDIFEAEGRDFEEGRPFTHGWVYRVRYLKAPAQDTLTLVSSRNTQDDSLYQYYGNLVNHSPPPVIDSVQSVRESGYSWKLAIETPGMSHIYFR